MGDLHCYSSRQQIATISSIVPCRTKIIKTCVLDFFPDKKFAKNCREFIWYFQCQTKLSHLFVLSLSSCMKSISSSGRAFLLQWLIEKTKESIVKKEELYKLSIHSAENSPVSHSLPGWFIPCLLLVQVDQCPQSARKNIHHTNEVNIQSVPPGVEAHQFGILLKLPNI